MMCIFRTMASLGLAFLLMPTALAAFPAEIDADYFFCEFVYTGHVDTVRTFLPRCAGVDHSVEKRRETPQYVGDIYPDADKGWVLHEGVANDFLCEVTDTQACEFTITPSNEAFAQRIEADISLTLDSLSITLMDSEEGNSITQESPHSGKIPTTIRLAKTLIQGVWVIDKDFTEAEWANGFHVHDVGVVCQFTNNPRGKRHENYFKSMLLSLHSAKRQAKRLARVLSSKTEELRRRHRQLYEKTDDRDPLILTSSKLRRAAPAGYIFQVREELQQIDTRDQQLWRAYRRARHIQKELRNLYYALKRTDPQVVESTRRKDPIVYEEQQRQLEGYLSELASFEEILTQQID